MKKITIRTVAILAAIAASAEARGAVPLAWPVETSRVQPALFEAFHGETLALEAALNTHGTPLQLPTNAAAALFYQTNGMASAWWSIPASVSNNVIRATFAPSNDCGAAAYSCFLGVPASIYRAAFTLRFRHAPGEVPNRLENPVPVLDLANTTVINPPWPTDSTIAATVRRVIAEDGITAGLSSNEVANVVTSTVTRAYIEATGFSSGLDTNAVLAITAQDRAAISNLTAEIAAENAKFTVTNIQANAAVTNFSTLPSAAMSAKVDGAWSLVWNELTRWNYLINNYLPTNYASKADLDLKADRAWGFYDSATGNYSPDDRLWVSNPEIVLAGGLSYRNFATSQGSVWVLCSNGLVAQPNVASNGYFRISDDEGNTQFEIVKGGNRTIGADADGIRVVDEGGDWYSVFINYPITSDVAPTLFGKHHLTNETWNVLGPAGNPTPNFSCIWTGTPSDHPTNWYASVSCYLETSQYFFKAEYEVGGDTVIRQNAPVEMSYLYLGGQKYALGTNTISGKLVLTLTPAN